MPIVQVTLFIRNGPIGKKPKLPKGKGFCLYETDLSINIVNCNYNMSFHY